MKLGLTATRKGITAAQRDAFAALLKNWQISELHHGDCTGGDEQADALARAAGVKIVIHPPDSRRLRAFCFRVGDEIREPKSYLVRNHDIVNESDRLVALPFGRTEVLRSGTWATIRYAHKQGKPVFIIHHDGKGESR